MDFMSLFHFLGGGGGAGGSSAVSSSGLVGCCSVFTGCRGCIAIIYIYIHISRYVCFLRFTGGLGGGFRV